MNNTTLSRWLVVGSLVATSVLPSLSFAQDNATINTSTDTQVNTHTTVSLKIKSNNHTLSGKVITVSDNTITITAQNGGSYTIDASNAKLVRHFGAKMAVSDIQTGDTIKVRGTVNGSNISAKTVQDMSLQARNAKFEGTVKAVNGNSFTLQTPKRASQTVNTDSSTVFKKNGKAGQLSDIIVGASVRVEGVWDKANNNITAKTVNVIVKMKPVSIKGTLSAKTDTSLTVAGDNGTSYNVDISHARLTKKKGGKAMLADLTVGDTLQIKGSHLSESTDIKAIVVRDTSLTSSIKANTSASTNTNANTNQ